MTVRFNNLEELFLELSLRKDELQLGFVRMTTDYTPVNNGVTRVGVQISFRIDGETHLYEQVCVEEDILGAGDTGGTNEAKRLIEDVTSRLQEMGIATMGGEFEG